MKWIKDSLAGRPVHIEQIGAMYMYSGAWVPDMLGTSHSTDHTYHVGPHVMIITPHNEDLETFSHDGSNGQPYVAHPRAFAAVPGDALQGLLEAIAKCKR